MPSRARRPPAAARRIFRWGLTENLPTGKMALDCLVTLALLFRRREPRCSGAQRGLGGFVCGLRASSCAGRGADVQHRCREMRGLGGECHCRYHRLSTLGAPRSWTTLAFVSVRPQHRFLQVIGKNPRGSLATPEEADLDDEQIRALLASPRYLPEREVIAERSQIYHSEREGLTPSSSQSLNFIGTGKPVAWLSHHKTLGQDESPEKEQNAHVLRGNESVFQRC